MSSSSRETEGEWDQALESVRLILQIAQRQQVIDPFLGRLDVTVEHCAVRRNTGGMHDSGDFEPPVTVGFVIADLTAHSFGEDLRAATGARILRWIQGKRRLRALKRFS